METVEKERAALVKERDELKEEKEKYLREKASGKRRARFGLCLYLDCC